MKLKHLLLAILPALLPLLSRAQSGGPFDLSWSTIDSGGGISSAGQFIVSGTLASRMPAPRSPAHNSA